MSTSPRLMAPVLYAVFFLSGAAALLFETLWFRLAGLMLGNSIWSSSVVLAGFMGGLALGNALAARHARRLSRPVRTYAVLEIAIALSGVALVLVMPMLNDLLAPLFRPFADRPWTLNPLRLVMAFALLLVPTTAMGATLPILIKGLCRYEPAFGRALGMLYGFNTLGAVAGALIGEMVLIEALGVRGTAFVAAGANIVAAVIAWRLDRGAAESPPREVASSLNAESRRLLTAAFLCGAVLLALEVVWFRIMLLFTMGTSPIFAIMLAVILAGIGLGGLTGGAWLRREGAAHYAAAIAAISGALVIGTYITFTYIGDVQYNNAISANLPRAMRLMLPVAWLSGVLFTLIGQRLHAQMRSQTRAAGYLTLANTVGAMLGALIGGFVLLPGLGMERSICAAALVYLAVAALLNRGRRRRVAAVERIVLYAAVAVLAGAMLLFPFGLMRNRVVPIAIQRYVDNGEQMIGLREGLNETVIYMRTDRYGEPLWYRMLTNGYSMSGSGIGAQRYMKAFVYLPATLHPSPRKALLISYGVGSTAKALTDMSWLERIDVVDVSRDILEMSDIVFPDPATHPLSDPRINVHIEDGRFFLQTTDQQYDLITGEPPPPKAAGIGNLYSREYFQLMYDRLAPGGMATYWLPMEQLAESDSRTIVRAFADVFDDCSLWIGAGSEWILLGVRPGGRPATEAQFRRQWNDPAIRTTIRDLGFEHPEQLGSSFIADRTAIDELTRDTLPLTDDYPLRLSPYDTNTTDSRYSDLMDRTASLRRFRDSDHIRRLWPESIRTASEPYFQYRYMVHDVFSNVKVSPPFLPQAALYPMLTKTDLHAAVLWQYQTDENEQRILHRVKVPPDGRMHYKLGAGAMADRRYENAAAHFREARLAAPTDTYVSFHELLALCLAGRTDEAVDRAPRIIPAHTPVAQRQAWWAFAAMMFNIHPPPHDSTMRRGEP